MTKILSMLTKKTPASGQVMIEFALVIPILVLIFLGTMDLARAVYAYGVISDAARVGAHWASLLPLNSDGSLNVSNGDASIEKHIRDKTAGLEWSRIKIATPVCQPPTDGTVNPYQTETPPSGATQAQKNLIYCRSWNQVTVTVTYDYQPITMFFARFSLQAKSTMTIE